MKYNTCKILEFKSTREPIKVLGICLSYNQDRNIEDLWLSRDFTLCGKFFLTKTFGVSQLVYAASLLSVPNAVIKIV